MDTRTRCLTTTMLAALTAVGAGVLTAQPAAAAYNVGIKSVHLAPANDSCIEDPAYPCTPDAGVGNANEITVLQHGSGADFEFDTIETTSHSDSFAWLAAEIGAECRSGYRLWSAFIDNGSFVDDGGLWAVDEVMPPDGWNGLDVSVPNARLMPNKTVALHIPLDTLFNETTPHEFTSVEDIYARGEQIVADRMAGGMSEVTARSIDASVDVEFPIYSQVICRGTGLAHYKYYKVVSTDLSLEVRFEGVEMPVQGRVPQASHFGIANGVDEATVIVQPDLEECALHVNGVLESDTDLDVTYRLLDSFGQGSQLFEAEIEGGIPTFVSHTVAMPVDDGGLDGPGFVNPHAGLGGPATDLADHETDMIQGTFQIEVLSPNHLLSNVDGFSVEPGTCTPDADFEPAADGFVVPSRPTH